VKKISTKVKPLQTGGDGTAYYGEEVIKEKALSKKQQRFFGIVRAIQKGEQEPTTPETAKAAADMKKSDVKKYASTKHAKLPEKKIDEVYRPKRDAQGNIIPPKFNKLPYYPKTDAEGNIIPPKFNKLPYYPKTDAQGNIIPPKLRPLKGGEIKEAVPLLVKAAMLGAGMVAKKALAGKKKKKEKEEVGPTVMVTKVVEELDKKDKPFIKKLVKNLKKGSKTHEKQAKKLEKAMNEDITDEALTIQDWNIDDIKFTEIETVDIIKAKPIKESNIELDEKFKFLKHAFGKSVILGTGADKMMGKFPRLSSKGAKSLIKNKSQLAIKGFKDAIQKVKDLKKIPDAPITFPRDKQIIKVKKKTNPNAIFPTKANVKIKNEIISDTGISTKNPIKKIKKDIKDHYDWRAELDEDWQKVNRKDKTDGLSKAAVKAYRRENPGSKLQTAVTKDPKKLKKGSKSAKRRLSFCRRMKGMKKKLTSAKTRRDPDSRINKALRRWNC
jgi:hypothetical protein